MSPTEENVATSPGGVEPSDPVVEAPTVKAFFEVPGGVMPWSLPGPKSPAEKRTMYPG